MSSERKNLGQTEQFKRIDEQRQLIKATLDNLTVLVDNCDLDSKSLNQIQLTFNNVLNKKLSEQKAIDDIKSITLLEIDDLEKLDKLEILLNTTLINSKTPRRVFFNESILRIVKSIIGLLLITLGFAMVVMPTPHTFEMFTIFWFNPNDGVTLMDIISLIIIALGTYIVIKSFTKFNF